MQYRFKHTADGKRRGEEERGYKFTGNRIFYLTINTLKSIQKLAFWILNVSWKFPVLNRKKRVVCVISICHSCLLQLWSWTISSCLCYFPLLRTPAGQREMRFFFSGRGWWKRNAAHRICEFSVLWWAQCGKLLKLGALEIG